MFTSCNYNERIVDNENGPKGCTPCESDAPFSYGFSQEKCYECRALEDQVE